MNSIFENLNTLESYEATRERLAHATCDECGYVGIHSRYPLCSKRVG